MKITLINNYNPIMNQKSKILIDGQTIVLKNNEKIDIEIKDRGIINIKVGWSIFKKELFLKNIKSDTVIAISSRYYYLLISVLLLLFIFYFRCEFHNGLLTFTFKSLNNFLLPLFFILLSFAPKLVVFKDVN